ncbi:hypothetical protein SAMN04487977_104313 [Treponema bryantii]|uniref:Uncharacterized protein n=2 Tax=Treponema bryantii TaxID=163 RepID=A0A1H9G8S4_9SPIR|nr:hypothetical protein SAMN04487977_104313 [Treponema bryantii]
MWKSISVIILMNGLKIQWGINILVASTSTLIQFPLIATHVPFLIVTHHKNDASGLRMDMLGYYVDRTGFKTNYFTGHGIDYLAIGY